MPLVSWSSRAISVKKQEASFADFGADMAEAMQLLRSVQSNTHEISRGLMALHDEGVDALLLMQRARQDVAKDAQRRHEDASGLQHAPPVHFEEAVHLPV